MCKTIELFETSPDDAEPETLKANVSADGCQTSFSSDPKAFRFVRDINALPFHGGSEVMKRNSILSKAPGPLVSLGASANPVLVLPVGIASRKALGLSWKAIIDVLVFHFEAADEATAS